MAEVWTPLKLLGWTQGFFAQKGVDAPRLTAELLLAHALGCDRVKLYLDFDKPLGAPELERYRELVRRRAGGEPTAYLIGAREFFGHRLSVDARVLVPRPETELVAEAALAALPEGGAALDLGTGSGALAIALALGRPGAKVTAVDLSADALTVARANAAALGAEVTFLEGDLYAPVPAGARFDVVVSNPPYVPTGELAGLQREVQREPRLALDGGPDGLAALRRIAAEAPRFLLPGGTLVLEMHESHEASLPALCRAAGFAEAEARRDLAGLPRFVVARMAAAPPAA
ncbi:MAG TPA: peptide chain release factor N(5)-glutamine methyltransferase [Anaeromyxobacteraceae bacterium]|nr:peptide chain release factor N(5)-glutamine methyltransferase [Anaeromyxobacteraceae bacterium]